MSTLPAILSNHVHVSERQTGAWVDCTWDSGVEYVRLTHNPAIPATHAEGDALRAASGYTGTGGRMSDLRTGILVRYKYTPPVAVTGAANLWSALKPGTAAVVQGSMSAFGPTDPLSRFDPQFDGGHAVLVARVDSTDRVWWCDPEAPVGSYEGQFVTKSQLFAFVNSFAGSHIVSPILTVPKENTVYPLTAFLPGQKATIKVQSNIRSDPHIAATKFRTTTAVETQTLIGTVKGDVDPANGSDVWYMWWANGRYEFTAKDNVTAVTVTAADDGYTAATQAAAVTAQKAADQVAQATAVAAAKADAISSERSRIRGILGV